MRAIASYFGSGMNIQPTNRQQAGTMKAKFFAGLLALVLGTWPVASSGQTPKVTPDDPLTPLYANMLRAQHAPVMDEALERRDIPFLENKIKEIMPIVGGPDFLLSWFISHLNEGDTFWIGEQLAILAWKIGVVSENLNTQGSNLFKTRAVVAAINVLVQIKVEGARCDDATAWQAKWDAVMSQRPLWQFAGSLSATDRRSIITGAIATEERLAPRRRNDAILCIGGLDTIGKALADGAPATASTVPGLPGRTITLAIDPKDQPKFAPEEIWRKRQGDIRKTLPALLSAVLQVSG